jgi:hypothetical protein
MGAAALQPFPLTFCALKGEIGGARPIMLSRMLLPQFPPSKSGFTGTARDWHVEIGVLSLGSPFPLEGIHSGRRSKYYSLMGIALWPSQAELGGIPEASIWLFGLSLALTATQRSYIPRFRIADCLSCFFLRNPRCLRARRLAARNAKPLFRLCGLTFDILRRD